MPVRVTGDDRESDDGPADGIRDQAVFERRVGLAGVCGGAQPRGSPAVTRSGLVEQVAHALRIDHEVTAGERGAVPRVLSGGSGVECQQQRSESVVHAGGGHLPGAGESRQRVAPVTVGDEPAREDEVLGIREFAHDPILPLCAEMAYPIARTRTSSREGASRREMAPFIARMRISHRRGAHLLGAQPTFSARNAPSRGRELARHSHSIVPGGLLVTSSTTRLTSRTSFVMRFEMRASTS